jgi:hypothetical protein
VNAPNQALYGKLVTKVGRMVTIEMVASLLPICAAGGWYKGIDKKVRQHSFAKY